MDAHPLNYKKRRGAFFYAPLVLINLAMKTFEILIIALLFCFKSYSQSTFQVVQSNSNFRIEEILTSKSSNQIISLSYPSVNSDKFYLSDISIGPGNSPGISVTIPGTAIWAPVQTYLKDSIAIVMQFFDQSSQINGLNIFAFNFNTQESWLKYSPFSTTFADFTINDRNKTIVTLSPTFPFPLNKIFFYSIDNLTGQVELSKGIEIQKPDFSFFTVGVKNIDFIVSEGYCFSGSLFDVDGTNESYPFVAKLNNSFEPVVSRIIYDFELEHQYLSPDGSVYLLGKSSEPISPLNNTSNAKLIKLDSDLNVIWSRVFFAEEFDYKSTTLNIIDDSNLVLSYSTYGAFPVILAKLDENGNIIWQKGYPLYEPQIEIQENGGLLMLTKRHFQSDGTLFFKYIISKTDPQGNIGDCETLNTCLRTSFSSVRLDSFESISTIPSMFDTLEYEISNQEIAFSEFCDNPTPPSPEFIIPDTICINDCIKTKGTNNKFAHGIEWNLTGPNTSSQLKNDTIFQFCFSNPGNYQLKQTIWYLGCSYTFEKHLIVLDTLEFEIESDSIICENPPIFLRGASNRQIKNYLWSSNLSGETLKVLNGGDYSVTVNDGFCEAVDSIKISFLSEIIENESVLNNPRDTLICEAQKPFVYVPRSPFTDEFYFGQNQVPFDSLELNETGSYAIGLNVKGCLIFRQFFLEINNCEPSIYIPNAFSPNGDGINDRLEPLGKGFESQGLKIYDRWGNLIFSGKNENSYWNGKYKGKLMSNGVYVYVFSYKNLITGKIEFLIGDFTLVL